MCCQLNSCLIVEPEIRLRLHTQDNNVVVAVQERLVDASVELEPKRWDFMDTFDLFLAVWRATPVRVMFRGYDWFTYNEAERLRHGIFWRRSRNDTVQYTLQVSRSYESQPHDQTLVFLVEVVWKYRDDHGFTQFYTVWYEFHWWNYQLQLRWYRKSEPSSHEFYQLTKHGYARVSLRTKQLVVWGPDRWCATCVKHGLIIPYGVWNKFQSAANDYGYVLWLYVPYTNVYAVNFGCWSTSLSATFVECTQAPVLADRYLLLTSMVNDVSVESVVVVDLARRVYIVVDVGVPVSQLIAYDDHLSMLLFRSADRLMVYLINDGDVVLDYVDYVAGEFDSLVVADCSHTSTAVRCLARLHNIDVSGYRWFPERQQLVVHTATGLTTLQLRHKQ